MKNQAPIKPPLITGFYKRQTKPEPDISETHFLCGYFSCADPKCGMQLNMWLPKILEDVELLTKLAPSVLCADCAIRRGRKPPAVWLSEYASKLEAERSQSKRKARR